MSEKNYVFGIDLGTTYSCISYMDETGHVVVCQNLQHSSNTTPSVVRLLPNEDPVVGETAKDTSILYPNYTCQFVKSKIGKMKTFNYGDNNECETTPIEVSAEILKDLAKSAEQYTNTKVSQVVITCPAYFGEAEREATKQAGILAGLDVLQIVEEPTAAAVYYGCTKADTDQTIMVFDLGGGTFDITVMKISTDNTYEVITTDGDHSLGGKDWDNAILDYVKQRFEDETGYSDEYDDDVLQELQLNVEKAKITLTVSDKASIPIKADREHRANIEITRDEFDAVTKNLLDTAIDLTIAVKEKVAEKYGIDKFDQFLLVGGSSKMPQVREAIVNTLGIEPLMNEPDASVSKGAAICAATAFIDKIIHTDLSSTDTESSSEVIVNNDGSRTISLPGKGSFTLPPAEVIGEIKLITVCTKSFAIRCLIDHEEKLFNLITKDTKLPVSITNSEFGTEEANQANVVLAIYENTCEEQICEVDEGYEIGNTILSGLQPNLPMNAPIEITLSVSEDGLIYVHGRDLTGNKEIEATFQSNGVLSKEEMEEKLKQ